MSASIPNRSGSVTTFAKREIPYIKILFVCFLLTLPIVNPTVHGDGVGYYAYARAILIQHNLRFEEDWRHANKFFSAARIQADEQLRPEQYTPTGYVDNHFTVGPAILWAPFLILAHLAVLLFNAVGGHISADGFSQPYLVAMALGTAFYGFLGLLFSFLLAKKYVRDRWAFLATMGIWFATSLPVYMYFNPAWSHAHSAFTVALFLWYWERTRGTRTIGQWVALGLISGLMIDVYFPNGVFLLLPLIEALLAHRASWRVEGWNSQRKLLFAETLFAVSLMFAVLPTFITRWIVFGGLIKFGAYTAYGLDLERSSLVASTFLVGPWRAQLDADFGAGVDRAFHGTAKCQNNCPISGGGCRCVLLRNCMLSLLGWHGVIRKSLSYFAYSRFRFWAGIAFRSRRSLFSGWRAGVCCRCRIGGFVVGVECRVYFSVGRAPGSSARRNFFSRNDP